MPKFTFIDIYRGMLISLAAIFILSFQNAYSRDLWKDATKDLKREFESCFSGGCDVIGEMNKRIDSGIKSKSRAMAEGVREVFEPAIDRLMQDKIRPLLDDIYLLIRSNLKDSAEIALTRLDRTIIEAIDKTEESVKDSVESSIKSLSIELDRQRDLLVNEVNAVFNLVDCAVTGQRFSIEKFIDKKTDYSLSFFRDSCQKSLGLSGNTTGYTNYQLYDYGVCKISSELTINSPIKNVLDVYGELQFLAANFRCLTRSAPAASTQYTKEWIKYGKLHNIWNKTQIPSN